MISCVNVTILDDDSVGPLTEEFSISLEAVQEDSRIQVNTKPSRIVIIENDGMPIRISKYWLCFSYNCMIVHAL